MNRKNIERMIITFLLFLIVVLVLSMLASCGTREKEPAYMQRFEFLGRDDFGAVVVEVTP